MNRNRSRNKRSVFRAEPPDLNEVGSDKDHYEKEDSYEEDFHKQTGNRRLISESIIKDPSYMTEEELSSFIKRSVEAVERGEWGTLSDLKSRLKEALEIEKIKRGII